MREATRISDTSVREELQLQQSTLRRLLRMLGIGGNKVADCAEDHEATVAADLD